MSGIVTKTKIKYRTRTVKSKRGHRHVDKIHLIPDLFYAGAVAEPFINSDNTGNSNAIGYLLSNGGGDVGTTLEGTIWRVKQNLMPSLKDAVILGAVGYGFQWLGKVTRFNRIGSKKVKLL